MNEEKIIEKFVNSKDFFVIENYISKPYEETIEELEHNWNELEKWLREQIGRGMLENSIFIEVIHKMQELEEGGNNDNNTTCRI